MRRGRAQLRLERLRLAPQDSSLERSRGERSTSEASAEAFEVLGVPSRPQLRLQVAEVAGTHRPCAEPW